MTAAFQIFLDFEEIIHIHPGVCLIEFESDKYLEYSGMFRLL